MPDSLKHARQRIDAIDRALVRLLAERQAIVDEVCQIKADADRPTKDSDREDRLFARLRELADEMDLSRDMVESLFEQIVAHSVGRQRKKRRGGDDSPRDQLLRLLDEAA